MWACAVILLRHVTPQHACPVLTVNHTDPTGMQKKSSCMHCANVTASLLLCNYSEIAQIQRLPIHVLFADVHASVQSDPTLLPWHPNDLYVGRLWPSLQCS